MTEREEKLMRSAKQYAKTNKVDGRVLLVASCFMVGDSRGHPVTEYHTFPDTDEGWRRITSKQREYRKRGWNTAIPAGEKK